MDGGWSGLVPELEGRGSRYVQCGAARGNVQMGNPRSEAHHHDYHQLVLINNPLSVGSFASQRIVYDAIG
jgi:hypothetical protein